jgi:hypothetical protein
MPEETKKGRCRPRKQSEADLTWTGPSKRRILLGGSAGGMLEGRLPPAAAVTAGLPAAMGF